MVTTILSHAVENFEKWLGVFNEHESVRTAAGIRVKGVYRGADNPNQVTVITEADNHEAFDRFMADPTLAEAMKNGGVTGPPQATRMTEVK